MGRTFRSAMLASVLLAACSLLIPAAAAPLSVSSAAFAGLDAGAPQIEQVATRRKPVRSIAKSRKSSGVQVAPTDVNGDGTPDTVTTKLKTKQTTKPTSKPTSTGGVHVQ